VTTATRPSKAQNMKEIKHEMDKCYEKVTSFWTKFYFFCWMLRKVIQTSHL
jgi:hypothetical protein